MINCGHCGGRHATVAAVRVCSGTVNIETIEQEMHRMEAEEDRAQTYREERDKARFKAAAESWSPAERERAAFERGMRNRDVAGLKHEVRELLETKVIPDAERRWADAMKRYLERTDCTDFALKNAIMRLNGFRNVRAGGYPSEQASAPGRKESEGPSHEGLYRLSRDLHLGGVRIAKGTYVQVLRAKGSQRLYAKRVDGLGSGKRPTLTYVAGLIFKLTDVELLTAEEAQEVTRQTGWCVFGHFLTNKVSIARGMGPKCYERYPHLARNVA